MNSLRYPVLFPVHPRIKKSIKEIASEVLCNNIHFIEPLGYIDMIYFAKNAVKIITDSGGLHKEAFWLKVPAVVILRNTAWEETLKGNCNVLAQPDENDILDKVNNTVVDYDCFDNKYGVLSETFAFTVRLPWLSVLMPYSLVISYVLLNGLIHCVAPFVNRKNKPGKPC